MSIPGFANQAMEAPSFGAAVDEFGAIHCRCGNTPDWDGFDACHKDGTRDDSLLYAPKMEVVLSLLNPRGSDANRLHYVCNRCDAVYGPWPSVFTVREGGAR